MSVLSGFAKLIHNKNQVNLVLTLIASFSSLAQAQVGYSMLGLIFSTLLSPIVEICIGFYVWSVADAIAARITRDDS